MKKAIIILPVIALVIISLIFLFKDNKNNEKLVLSFEKSYSFISKANNYITVELYFTDEKNHYVNLDNIETVTLLSNDNNKIDVDVEKIAKKGNFHYKNNLFYKFDFTLKIPIDQLDYKTALLKLKLINGEMIKVNIGSIHIKKYDDYSLLKFNEIYGITNMINNVKTLCGIVINSNIDINVLNFNLLDNDIIINKNLIKELEEEYIYNHNLDLNELYDNYNYLYNENINVSNIFIEKNKYYILPIQYKKVKYANKNSLILESNEVYILDNFDYFKNYSLHDISGVINEYSY